VVEKPAEKSARRPSPSHSGSLRQSTSPIAITPIDVAKSQVDGWAKPVTQSNARKESTDAPVDPWLTSATRKRDSKSSLASKESDVSDDDNEFTGTGASWARSRHRK
jgi:hypothetical protein